MLIANSFVKFFPPSFFLFISYQPIYLPNFIHSFPSFFFSFLLFFSISELSSSSAHSVYLPLIASRFSVPYLNTPMCLSKDSCNVFPRHLKLLRLIQLYITAGNARARYHGDHSINSSVVLNAWHLHFAGRDTTWRMNNVKASQESKTLLFGRLLTALQIMVAPVTKSGEKEDAYLWLLAFNTYFTCFDRFGVKVTAFEYNITMSCGWGYCEVRCTWKFLLRRILFEQSAKEFDEIKRVLRVGWNIDLILRVRKESIRKTVSWYIYIYIYIYIYR